MVISYELKILFFAYNLYLISLVIYHLSLFLFSLSSLTYLSLSPFPLTTIPRVSFLQGSEFY